MWTSRSWFGVLCLAILVTLLAGCGEPTASLQPEPVRVLFVGNSLTFYNDMPGMFAALADSGGHQVQVAQSAFPGYSLARHSVDDRTTAKLEEQSWDYVILQEQSALPIIPGERDQSVVPAALKLDGAIREQGAETVLFLTWAYRDGYPQGGHDGYEAMQAALRDSYVGIAGELGASLAPVGAAWQQALEQDPELSLWEPDGIHPNAEGSYLAAAVFYAALFDESPAGLPYTGEKPLSPETTSFLQIIAAETVLARPEDWNLRR